MKLYVHPSLSPFCHKVLMACYEKQLNFETEYVDPINPEPGDEFVNLTPWGRVPILVDDNGRVVSETSIIIEYLDMHKNSGVKLIPEDKELALSARYWDRVMDCYLIAPLRRLIIIKVKPEDPRLLQMLAPAHEQANDAFAWMDRHFETHQWAVGDAFSMADCGTAAGLYTASLMSPFDKYPYLMEYWSRIQERDSFQKLMKDISLDIARKQQRVVAKSAAFFGLATGYAGSV
jgi:glutathione S-transferase